MQKTEDNRKKLAAMELFKDTHLTKLELLSNATTIDSALQFIRSKQQEQQSKASQKANDSSDKDNDDTRISNPITQSTATATRQASNRCF